MRRIVTPVAMDWHHDTMPRTVQRLAADGIIPATKLPGPNGAYLFTREDVDAYASASEAEAS